MIGGERESWTETEGGEEKRRRRRRERDKIIQLTCNAFGWMDGGMERMGGPTVRADIMDTEGYKRMLYKSMNSLHNTQKYEWFVYDTKYIEG